MAPKVHRNERSPDRNQPFKEPVPEVLAEQNVLPYLGEDLSVHARPGFRFPDLNAASSMPRSQSLEGLTTVLNNNPCMIKMPPSRSYSELGDTFETIPPFSWIFPYIVACCPPLILSQLLSLPSLFDNFDDDDNLCSGIDGIEDHHIDRFAEADTKNSLIITRPRLASDGDSHVRQNSPRLHTYYNHRSLSSRPPFALNNNDPRTPRSPRNEGTVANKAIPGVPVFSFPPTWRSLGIVLLNKDPSWRPWEYRMVMLLDNYLFECSRDGSTVIGYAQLCGATVTKQSVKDMSKRPDNPWIQSSIMISCRSSSAAQSSSVRFWLTVDNAARLDVIAAMFLGATRLGVDDIFDFNRGSNGEQVLLGRGRFNEVKLSQRRSIVHWPAGPQSNSQPFSASPVQTKRKVVSSPPKPLSSQDAEEEDFLIFGDLDNNSSDSGESPGAHVDGDDQDDQAIANEAYDTLTGLLRTSTSSDPCAVKLIVKEGFWERVLTGKERADALVREVLSQALLTSQNSSWCKAIGSSSTDMSQYFPIVQIYSVLETSEYFAMELELMEGMDLFDKLVADGRMKEDSVRSIMAQLVMAISLCNRNGIAHRDIKLSNITFPSRKTKTDDKAIEVKLADFGMAGFVGSDKKLRGRCGTPGYVAPDILNAGVHGGYDLNVDMFSVSAFVV